MSAEENKACIRRYFDALAKDKSPATVNQYVADSDEELKQHIIFFEAAFPGYQMTIEDLVAEGDKVAVRAMFQGTHRGDLMGVLPTGKQVTTPVMLIYRLAGGKIVEHWMNADQLGMMQQLGVIPPMGQGGQ